MTDEEKFRFDLTGFLVRPAILSKDEVDAIVDQLDRIRHNPESLPPEHRAVPGGASNVLIDHPKVIEVLHQIIGPDVRMESTFFVWREKGQEHGGLHGGGPRQADPIFGYRVNNGRIHAGMVRVVFELTDISKDDGATHFIVGSHKSNFPMHSDHMSLEEEKKSPFLMTYECPAGSAIFFTENLCHAGPVWQRETPRIAILNAYAHLATHWHRLRIPPEVLNGLPREKQAYFREPWIADFRTSPATHNTIDRFIEKDDEPPINTNHSP
ncbi:MAG: phytanoyl-CoA dioxygenase family protein [Candidatus Poribacteria bacterium]|nr:phytanoyl-CoA dioxygenase family protein [Candidatus Poribacteria bacterium]